MLDISTSIETEGIIQYNHLASSIATDRAPMVQNRDLVNQMCMCVTFKVYYFLGRTNIAENLIVDGSPSGE